MLFRMAGGAALVAVIAESGRVVLGSNEHTVIPGKIYRSAQLTQKKLERVITEKRIRTVLNLRGCCPETAWYQADAAATHAAGICQEDLTFSAKRHPPAPEIARMIEVFDRTEYPILLHCAAGADRTGLASGIALLLQPGSELSMARRQMWPRYGHIGAVGRTGVLDEFFDAYEACLQSEGIPHSPERFRKWATTEYCPGQFLAELAVVSPDPLVFPAGTGFSVVIRAVNRSVKPWQFSPGGSGGVYLRYDLYAMGGDSVYRGQAGQFAKIVAPGEAIELTAGFPPIKTPGPHLLHLDLIDAQPINLLDSAFMQYGSEPLVVNVMMS